MKMHIIYLGLAIIGLFLFMRTVQSYRKNKIRRSRIMFIMNTLFDGTERSEKIILRRMKKGRRPIFAFITRAAAHDIVSFFNDGLKSVELEIQNLQTSIGHCTFQLQGRDGEKFDGRIEWDNNRGKLSLE